MHSSLQCTLMIESSDLKYTLCFLTRGDQVLMLHRQNPPNQGLWNGVGGHLEAGESARACALREVFEETGFQLNEVRFAGLVTWEGFETPPGGLYIFMAEAPEGEPGVCNEGALEWKPWNWVLHNPEVVSNIAIFGPAVLEKNAPRVYHFVYRNGQIDRYEFHSLPEWIAID
jgi:8-oxo-dGTP diphosphatase